MFYYQKKGIPSENPFLFRKELYWLFSLNSDKDDDAGQNKTVKPTATMALYKDGVDISGSTVKLTDVVTMLIQLDDEYIGNKICITCLSINRIKLDDYSFCAKEQFIVHGFPWSIKLMSTCIFTNLRWFGSRENCILFKICSNCQYIMYRLYGKMTIDGHYSI